MVDGQKNAGKRASFLVADLTRFVNHQVSCSGQQRTVAAQLLARQGNDLVAHRNVADRRSHVGDVPGHFKARCKWIRRHGGIEPGHA